MCKIVVLPHRPIVFLGVLVAIAIAVVVALITRHLTTLIFCSVIAGRNRGSRPGGAGRGGLDIRLSRD